MKAGRPLYKVNKRDCLFRRKIFTAYGASQPFEGRRPASRNSTWLRLATAIFLEIVLLAHASPVFAVYVSVPIMARVTSVIDTDDVLGGAVKVGDIISGSYVYDTSAGDLSPEDPSTGQYACYTGLCGMSVTAGGFEFRTDPFDIRVAVGIFNNVIDESGTVVNGLTVDKFQVRSDPNIFGTTLPADAYKWISLTLVDPTASVLTSDALLTQTPILAQWAQPGTGAFGLTIGSHYITGPPVTFPPVHHVMGIYAQVIALGVTGVNIDSDGDGVEDAIDAGDGTFADAGVPQTVGSIVNTGGLNLYIRDAYEVAEGVEIFVDSVYGGSQSLAELRVCGYPVWLSEGDSLIVTCGSITVKAVEGSITVGLGDDGGTVEIPAGAIAKVSQKPDGTSAVENLGETPITVATEAGTSTVNSGGILAVGSQFQGFFAPVNMDGTLNAVKAGSAVPLKWRLVRIEDGAPVTNLATAKVRVTGLDCALGTSTDLVEELAAGNSGLQNLGNGYYQFNWKTPKSYAKSCKTLHLDLGEGSADQTALFSFSK